MRIDFDYSLCYTLSCKRSKQDPCLGTVNRGMRVRFPREAVTVKRGVSRRSQKTCLYRISNDAVSHKDPRNSG